MLELNKVYCMDCLEGIKQIEDNCVDLVLTDPPYNFEAFGGGFYDLKNNDSARTYLSDLNKLDCNSYNPLEYLDECKRILKKFNGVFFCNKYLVDVYLKFARDNNYLFDIHVLVKSNPIPAKNNHFVHDSEYIIVIKEKGSYFFNDSDFNDYRKVYATTTFQDNEHPAQKPIGLIRKYIKVLSKENDVIFDGYLGSGTTVVACKQLNRRYIGFEINKKYIDICNKRLCQNTLQGTL